jgi:iron complex outermembrane receptor protein
MIKRQLSGEIDMRNRKAYFLLLTIALVFTLSGNITAQTEATSDEAEATPEQAEYALEEVFVSAQRRTESLQVVPISVTAISGDRIREGGIMNIADVALETPNFTFTQFNVGEPQYYIRGIGNTFDSAGSDPAVATFIDDVYIGRTGGTSMDLFDLDRIEVIRGPHGTLFGKNVVGGAISIYTNKPSPEFESKLGLTVGNYDQYMLRGLVNGRMTDNLSGKFSFSKQVRDGYVDNVVDDLVYHDADNTSMRGQMLWTPSDEVDVLFGLDYSKDDLNGNCRNVNNLELNDTFGVAEVFYEPVIEATTGGDIRKCASSAGAGQEREVGGALLRVDWSMEASTFTSITAYREADYKWSEDLAALPWGTTTFNLIDQAEEDSNQFSQEFRWASSGGETFDWLVGAFYMKENVDRAENFIGAFGPPFAAQGFFLLDGDVIFAQDNTTKSYALFAKLDWHITDTLSLSVGGRYAKDKKSIEQTLINQENPALDVGFLTLIAHPDPQVVLGIPANGPANMLAYLGTGSGSFLSKPFSVPASDSWSEFLPSADINWRFADNSLLYFTYSEGYKSGAFQSQTPFPDQAVIPLEPENVKNYEIGIKSEFADNRLRINASVFHMDYTNLQVFQLVGSLLVGGNAEATSEGLEVDAAALLTENWILGVTYGYLDAKYDTYILGESDLSGNRLPKASKHSGSINTTYTANLSGGSAIDFSAVYSAKSDFYFRPDNHPGSLEDGFGLLDASVTWRSATDRWNVSVWGRNLTDEEFRTHSILSNIAGTVDLWNLPRTYGVTLSWNY